MLAYRAANPDKFNPALNGSNANRAAKKAEKIRRKELAKQAFERVKEPIKETTENVDKIPAEKIVPKATKEQILGSKKTEEKSLQDLLASDAPPKIQEPELIEMEDIFSAPPKLDEKKVSDDLNEKLPPQPEEKAQENGQAGSGQATQPKSDESKQQSSGVNRVLATMVWGMIVQTCIRIFGEAFRPRKFPDGAGGFVDENDNVITAFVTYFESIGFVALSPLWNLLLSIASYFLIRFNVLLDWFMARKKKSNATKPSQAGQPLQPKGPLGRPIPQPAQRTEPPQPEPLQPQPQPAQEVEVEMSEPEIENSFR